MTYSYCINLDERGEFFADVRDPNGKTIYEIHGFDMFEDGIMRHPEDLDGLLEYLLDMEVLPTYATLKMGE